MVYEVRDIPRDGDSCNELAENLGAAIAREAGVSFKKIVVDQVGERCNLEFHYRSATALTPTSTMYFDPRNDDVGHFDWWNYASLADCEAELAAQVATFKEATNRSPLFAYCGTETVTPAPTRSIARPLPARQAYFMNITALGKAAMQSYFIPITRAEDPMDASGDAKAVDDLVASLGVGPGFKIYRTSLAQDEFGMSGVRVYAGDLVFNSMAGDFNDSPKDQDWNPLRPFSTIIGSSASRDEIMIDYNYTLERILGQVKDHCDPTSPVSVAIAMWALLPSPRNL